MAATAPTSPTGTSVVTGQPTGAGFDDQTSTALSRPWLRRFVGGPFNSTDLAAFILRLVFGVILLGQGMQKVFSFSIFGRASSTQEVADTMLTFAGYDHRFALSCLLTATEIIGGTLLILGLATPLGAAALMGIMFQFVSIQWPDGLFGHDDFVGFQTQLGVMAAAATIAYLGPGHLSLDRAFGWRLHGLRWGTYAIVFGLAVGVIVMAGFGPGLFSGPPAGP